MLGFVTVFALVQSAPLAPPKFSEVTGRTACTKACGSVDAGYPFQFMGTFKTNDECEATCAGNATCTIWIHSFGTGHCFWRLDGKWETTVQSDITSGCLSSVPGCPPPPAPPPPVGPFVPSNAPNMNGEYVLSPTPNGKLANTKFPTNFKDYPRGVEYFDVYSPPITSLYSQVFWTGLPPVDLPEDIVQRYKGKGMAVVGFEVDQVRKTAEGDISVPINVAYNHHFESNMIGANSRLEKIHFDGPNDPRIAEFETEMGHGIPSHEYHWTVKDLDPENPIPSHQGFGGGNGGEYRKSFHGYAPGYAQVIYSPEQFQITPMQIDTWNRDKMNLTGSPFVTGPVPRNSLAPPAGSPDSLYSGLLECPVTTRIRKEIEGGYNARVVGVCGDMAIQTATECFGAAASTLGSANNVYVTSEVNDNSIPSGCTVTSDVSNPLKINVIYNHANSKSSCDQTATQYVGETSSLVNVSINLDKSQDLARITLKGPSDVWFGVGFNASAMKDSPWTIICEGTGNISERRLADQSPGIELPPSITVVSNTVENGVRTVVATRKFSGSIFSFNPQMDTVVPFINAVGSGPTLAYHKMKLPSQISLLPVGGKSSVGVCLCTAKVIPFGQGKGRLVYVQTNQTADVGQGTISFGNRCAPEPRTDMLAQHNPTCDVRTYVGGQTACHHMFSLLDADQPIPWDTVNLTYHQKFRFWVQPYNESYHTNLKNLRWGIASPVEYDVPKCADGVPGCSQDAEGNWIHTIRGTYQGGGKLAAAHFHCHAPTCITMQMYICNSSIEVCNETTGKLICREDPIYGGTGKISDPKFDEPGYILQPPCLWGDKEFGLEEPIDTTGYTLHTYKTSHAKYGHHGEMAWQQMYYF